MKYVLMVFAFLMILISETKAQSIMLEQDVIADTTTPKFGKNRRQFVGSFLSTGSMFGSTTGDSAHTYNAGKSGSLGFGTYYKLRFSNLYSIVGSVSYRFSRYDMKPLEGQKYNRIITNEVMGELVQRFNYGRRGDYIGRYVELGFSADYLFNSKSKTRVNPDDPDLSYKSRKLVLVGLNYLEKVNYSAHARFGFNKYVLTFDYRLTDLVSKESNFTLPPMMIGLRVDLGA